MANTREECIRDGYLFYCLGCATAYKKIPQEWYEDGHGGRYIDMCRCGSDLFANMKDDTPAHGD